MFDELNKRAKKVIRHLEEKHENQTILCVSHATAMKAIVGNIVFGKNYAPKIFLAMYSHVWIKNTGITICEKSKEFGWTLNTWNDMTHLS